MEEGIDMLTEKIENSLAAEGSPSLASFPRRSAGLPPVRLRPPLQAPRSLAARRWNFSARRRHVMVGAALL